MSRLAIVWLAVVLAFANGIVPGRTSRAKYEIAHLMMSDSAPAETATTCDAVCCVEAAGERRLLKTDETYIHPDEPCVVHICDKNGATKKTTITCPSCKDDSTAVKYIDTCCPSCAHYYTAQNEPQECTVTSWSEWGQCGVTCGAGKQGRKRTVVDFGNTVDGVNCVKSLSEIKDCNPGPCPVNCEWKWGAFGACDATCGHGINRRYPIITQVALHGGEDCPQDVHNNVSDNRGCFNRPCNNCTWSWGEWSECSKSCGGGMRERTAIVENQGEEGGQPCQDSEMEMCNDNQCPKCDMKECNIKGVVRCIDEKDDTDNDCVPDDMDNCKDYYNPDQKDIDMDGIGDPCDKCNKSVKGAKYSNDGDSIEDACDNCIYQKNEGQENHDDDETGDACDPDDDNDGIIDVSDNCKLVKNKDQADMDGDRIGDVCDNCPTVKNENQADKDEDGVGNACDNCRFEPNPDQTDSDGDGAGDACDTKRAVRSGHFENGDWRMTPNGEQLTLLDQIMEKLLETYYLN